MMYRRDQIEIEEWARASPERTAHVVRFVLCTINRRFEQTARKLKQAVGGDYTAMTGHTRDGFVYAGYFANELYLPQDAVVEMSTSELVEHYLTVPGLGIVKAGFVVQLLHGRAGCLDRHNLRMLGFSRSAFDRPATTGALRKRIAVYLATIDAFGGSRALWDAWCEHLAALRPKAWSDAEHVSRYHVLAITETYRK